MKKLAFAVTLLTLPLAAPAQEVVYQHGRVVYSGQCDGGRMFHYFDGTRLQRPCIGSTELVSLDKFMRYSRMGHCDFQVLVNYGEVVDGVLYATDIEEGRYCSDPGGNPMIR